MGWPHHAWQLVPDEATVLCQELADPPPLHLVRHPPRSHSANLQSRP